MTAFTVPPTLPATPVMTANGGSKDAPSYPVAVAVPVPLSFARLPPQDGVALAALPQQQEEDGFDLPVATATAAPASSSTPASYSAATADSSSSDGNGSICLTIQRRSKDFGRDVPWYIDYRGRTLGKLWDGSFVKVRGIRPGSYVGVTVQGWRHVVYVRPAFDAAAAAAVEAREARRRNFPWRSSSLATTTSSSADGSSRRPPAEMVIRLKLGLSFETGASAFASRMWIEPTRTMNPDLPGWLTFAKDMVVAIGVPTATAAATSSTSSVQQQQQQAQLRMAW